MTTTWNDQTRPGPSVVYSDGLIPPSGEVQPSERLMGLVMAVIALTGYVLVVSSVNTLVVGLGYRVEGVGRDWETYQADATAFRTAWGVLASHLGIAGVTLVPWVLYRFVHRRRLSWLWSVSSSVRWRYALLCFIVAGIVIGSVMVYHGFTGAGENLLPGWGWYVAVFLVTTPFQALGEEALFRGYLLQALGLAVRQIWFPIVVTAGIFALFHGTQDPWLFGSRLVFGLLAGVLVWRTGGLEAAVAIHIVNNLCAFGLAIYTGTLSQIRTATAITWDQAVLDVGMFAVCALACWVIAVKLRVPTRTPAHR